jgi:hypothetical protein
MKFACGELPAFNRLDKGKEYVDYHVLLIQGGPRRGLNHVAFEIRNVDDAILAACQPLPDGVDIVERRSLARRQIRHQGTDATDAVAPGEHVRRHRKIPFLGEPIGMDHASRRSGRRCHGAR